MRILNLILLFILCSFCVNGQRISFAPIFASGMVIQQQSDVSIWGKGAPFSKIELIVSWSKKKYSAIVDENGRWEIVVLTPDASFKPQEIQLKYGSDKILLEDILIGDVWFLGGQSNMQMSFRGNPDQPVENAQSLLLKAPRKGIRLFKVEQGYALDFSDTLSINGKWNYSTPEYIKDFSVIGYIFGQRLHDIVNIPIGLIQSAHGGSKIEAWIDKMTLKELNEFNSDFSANQVDPIWYSFSPSVLYNRMIAPLLPLSIKGVVWYQGESNVSQPKQYKKLFHTLVNSWRSYFQNENMPFYYTQIAPYEYSDVNSAYFREVQLELMYEIKNIGMAVTLDVGEQDIIHPRQKEKVAERLAFWALNKNYGHKAFSCIGPVLDTMIVKDNGFILKFHNAENGLSFMQKEVKGFEIAGENKVFYPAKVRITPSFWGNEGLEVWSDTVLNPVAVRYGFLNYIDGCLYNTDGIPASSFRTDKW